MQIEKKEFRIIENVNFVGPREILAKLLDEKHLSVEMVLLQERKNIFSPSSKNVDIEERKKEKKNSKSFYELFSIQSLSMFSLFSSSGKLYLSSKTFTFLANLSH
jgi:hypothetical protein